MRDGRQYDAMQAVDFNIFEGMAVHGVASVTISRGKVVWQHNQVPSTLMCLLCV